MKVQLRDIKGGNQGELEVKFVVIENRKYTQTVHDSVVAHRAAQRMGTACTKTMGEVAGSGKKPWRQKGTGRARAGSFASPLWRGGGVTFGPKPRDFGVKLNRKVKQIALRKALSERLRAGDVVVVPDLKLASPKTKGFLEVIKALDLKKTILVVQGESDQNLNLATRNLPNVDVALGSDVNTYQVLRSDKLLFTKSAWEQVEQRLLKN